MMLAPICSCIPFHERNLLTPDAQAADMEQEMGNSGALSRNKAAVLAELLTQKLLALDNIDTQGDRELRQERKAEINKINRLLDHLEAMKGR